MEDDYPHFKDFNDKKPQLEGEKKNIGEIFNTKILITGYRVGKSKYYRGKEYPTLQFKLNDKLYIIFTSSDPLIKQAKQSDEKKKIPFYTTIIQQGNYYTNILANDNLIEIMVESSKALNINNPILKLMR